MKFPMKKIACIVLAITMILGMSMTAWAVPVGHNPSCISPDFGYTNNGNGTHTARCTCGYSYSESCSPNSGWQNESGKHFKYCICDTHLEEADHVPGGKTPIIEYDGRLMHVSVCTTCNCLIDGTGAEHDTNGANGTCSECGFDPNASCGPKPTADPTPSNNNSQSTPQLTISAYEQKEKDEETLNVNSFTSSAAIATIPAEVKVSASTGSTYNLSNIVTTKGFLSSVDKIVQASPFSATVMIYQQNYMPFNDEILKNIHNTGKDFVYSFKYQGHLYSITIPANANIQGVIDRSDLFVGPLWLGQIFGTTKLIK